SFAAALGIKLVPVVALPLLLFVALRAGVPRFIAFCGGFGALFALLWAPVVVNRWTPFKINALEYAGVSPRQWGLIQFGRWAGVPHSWLDFLPGPGRYFLVLTAAAVPVLIAWRRPD